MTKEPSGKRVGQLNLNTIVGGVTLALILWFGSKVQSLNDKMTRIETLMEVRSAELAAVDRRVVVMEGLIGLKPKQP